MEDQYLDAFVHEAEEAITTLNNSLLALESDPDDEAAMDRIFREAHTLKGNFGAMGFEDAATLAHALEDLLDDMRDGEVAVTPAVMDLVFAGVDRLEAVVDDVEEHGEVRVDPTEHVDDLRAAIEAGGVEDRPGADTVPDPRGTDAAIEADETRPVATVEIDLGDTDMPGVDAMFAIGAVEDAFDVVGTDPEREAIEDGAYDGTVSLALASADEGRIESELAGVSRIASATVTDVTTPSGESEASATAGDEQHTVDEITSVRVDVAQLDDLHGLVEQLVTSRIKLRRALAGDDLDGAADTLQELDKITDSLQSTVMDMRLVPLEKVVGKFPRLVRDLARELDKDVDFVIEGEDIELDRSILTEISDPLLHILRNAVDHGIEPPAEREAAGKDPTGTVRLVATRERDHVTVEVSDDGGGLDADRISEQAAAQGIRDPDQLAAMDDSAIYDLIFHPGFSTASEVTDVSGRGVGMDVVHETVRQLDGSVNVESTAGEGTTVTLRLPVTMAIVKVLFVEVGEEEYGIPIKNVDEITRAGDVDRVQGREVVTHDDDLYPVIDLGETFDVDGETATNGDGMLVRIRDTERRVALRCDAVTSQEEVVVKPLEGALTGTPGLSGTAVLGDGKIVHILDVVTL